MKIIFLDIDGVLNCESSQWKSRGFKGIDGDKVALLNDIIAKTGAKIVLSSSWRMSDYGKDLVREHVDFIDTTPPMDTIRGYEILHWLSLHPDIKQYAILDDNADMLGQQRPHFFQTSFALGLTPEISERIITHLGHVSRETSA